MNIACSAILVQKKSHNGCYLGGTSSRPQLLFIRRGLNRTGGKCGIPFRQIRSCSEPIFSCALGVQSVDGQNPLQRPQKRAGRKELLEQERFEWCGESVAYCSPPLPGCAGADRLQSVLDVWIEQARRQSCAHRCSCSRARRTAYISRCHAKDVHPSGLCGVLICT